MSVLIDLLTDLIGSGLGPGPSSDRGLVAMSAIGSLVLGGLIVWLALTFPEPIDAPSWALGVLAASILVGAAGVMLSTLHFVRNPNDRLFAVVCATASVFALTTAGWSLARG